MTGKFPIVHFKKSGIISKPKDKGNVYIIEKGKAEVYEINGNHKFIHTILDKGEIFGDFGFDVYLNTFITALENTEVTVINTNKFVEIIKQNPKHSLDLLKYFYIKLFITQEKTVSLALDSVTNKLTKLLLQLSKPVSLSSEEHKVDKFTHQKLAQMLGISRQSVTITINGLIRKGLIKKNKRQLFFEKTKLMKHANGFANEISKIQLKLERLK